MSNRYKDKAHKLRDKYFAEVRLLRESWRDDLDAARAGSLEANLPEDWRKGWIEYLNLVIAIGEEKAAQLDAIGNAPTDKAAKVLVNTLNAYYEAEITHYKSLESQSRKHESPAIRHLAGLLQREADDREEYVKELNVAELNA